MKHTTWTACSAALILALVSLPAMTQTLEGDALVSALREGGCVIVMRHASSPHELPDAATANADNVDHERQLDAEGRREATAMGEALRRLGIPIGEVQSSPAYRAMETAHRMGLTDIEAVEQLGNEGMRASSDAYAAWLKANVAKVPTTGNRLLITHGPNLAAAFPDQADGLGEGDALVFRPSGNGAAPMIARLKMTDWPTLH